MTIPVAPDELPKVAGKYGRAAYVLTTGADSRVRITHTAVEVSDGRVGCELGRSASADAIQRSGVSVLWAATETESMSLIADGTARPDPEGGEGSFVIWIESAVLHRAAPL